MSQKWKLPLKKAGFSMIVEANEEQFNQAAELSEDQIYRTAEAVVDAAIVFHELRGRTIHSELRETLIHAIVDDPKVTARLFQSGGLTVH